MDFEAANRPAHNDDLGHQGDHGHRGDDAPARLMPAGLTAAAVANAIPLNAGADGVIVLPAGVELDDILVRGRDLVIQTGDGRVYVIIDGAIFVPTLVIDGVTVPPMNLAALLNGGEIQPAAGLTQSSGNNFAIPPGDIQDAYDLGDLLPYTDFGRGPEPTEEVIPGLVDRDPDVLIQDGSPPSKSAVDSVSEAGLPGTRLNGAAESPGTSSAGNSEITTGRILVTSPDGVATVTINGTTINLAGGTTITSPLGRLELGALANGEIPYTYTLLDNLTDNSVTDVFTVIVTDPDGDNSTATLTVSIVDDAPQANPNTNTVTEGALLTVAANGVLGNDVAGADGYAASGGVVGVATGSNTSQVLTTGVNTAIVGAYGTLTLKADGSYTYKADPNKITADAVDRFVYTIRDADGDTSTTTLDITVSNVTLAGSSVTRTVDEAALDGTKTGSDLDVSAVTGTTGANSPDETVTGTLVNPAAVANGYAPQSVTTTYGKFQLNADGSYVYTLINPVPSGAVQGANTVPGVETFQYSFVDANGNSGTGTITINVIDDVAKANPDANTVTEGALLTVPASGVLGNDVAGADGYAANGGVVGVATGSNTSQVLTTGVNTSITGAYGTLILQANGSYTYKSDPNKVTAATLDPVDHFVYTIRDADGDTSTTTLDIRVNDVTLGGSSITRTVDEAALDTVTTAPDLGQSTVTGTTGTNSPDETVTGTLVNAGAKPNGYVAQSVTTTFGKFQLNADGSYVYTLINPVQSGNNQGPNTVNGVETFQYSFTDANGNTGGGTITINVIDDVPTAVNDGSPANPYVVAENTPLTIPVLANDTFGADGQGTPAIVSVTQPANGTVTIVGNSVTVTPSGPGALGPASFTYTIKDADGDLSTATVYINYAADSQPNILKVDTVVVDEDGFTGVAPAPLSPVANPDGTGSGEIDSNEKLVNTGTIVINFGADVPASPLNTANMRLVDTAGLDTQLKTLDGNPVTFALVGGDLVGTGTGGEVIRIEFDSFVLGPNPGDVTYTYKVTLSQPVKHANGGGEASITLSGVTFEGQDSDGSTFQGTLSVAIFDDVPQLEGGTYAIGLVHEDALNTVGVAVGNSEGGQTTTATILTASLQALVRDGADGPVAISLNSALTGATGLTQNNVSIVWRYVSPTQVDGHLTGDPTKVVFSITQSGGDWTFTLKDNIDHDTDGNLLTGTSDLFATTLNLNSVFVATDRDGDPVVITTGVTVAIENDVPKLSGTPYDLGTVHEDALANAAATGNPEGGQTTIATILGASLQAMVSPGADSPVVIALNDTLSGSTGLTQNNVAIVWRYVSDTQVDGHVTGDTSKVVFSITKSGSDWTFTLKDNIDHGTLLDNNGDLFSETLDLDNVFVAIDSDGDRVPLSAGISIDIENDIPKLTGTPYQIGEVHEDALNTVGVAVGNPEGGQTTSATILTASLQAMFTVGADAPAQIVLNDALTGATGLTQNGNAINWRYVSATQIDGIVGNNTSAVVFSITKSGNDWTFTLKDNIDHDNDGSLLTGTSDVFATTLSLANVFLVIDNDGDRVPISAGITIDIENDVPIATNDRTALNPFVVAENTSLNIDVLGNDLFGADGPAATPIINVTQPALGSVTLEANNTITINPPANNASGDTTFTYTIRDADGDTSTATVYVRFAADSQPNILKVDTVVVDEDGFTGVAPAPLSPVANPDGTGSGEIDSNEKLVNTGTIVINFGADVPASPLNTTNMRLVDTAGLDTQLKTLDGNPVTFALVGGDLVGTGTGGEVIRIEFDSFVLGPLAGDVTYTYKVTLSQPVKHANGGGEASITLSGVTFEGQDSDGSTFQGTLSVEIFDDVPQAAGGSYAIGLVHEDALNTVGVAVGNSEGGQVIAATILTASLQALVSDGADGPVAISLNSALTGATGLTQNNVSIVWRYVSPTQVDGHLTGDTTKVVFSITQSGGDWTFTLKDNIDHDTDGNLLTGTSDVFATTLDLDNVFVATDRDGDPVVIAAGVSIDIQNDIPKLNTNTYKLTKVHEDALNNPNAVGNPEGGQAITATILTATLAGLVSAGADAPVAIALNSSLSGSTGLTQNNVAIVWRYVSDSQVDGHLTGDTSKVVFSITKSGNDWTFTLKDNIDHGTLLDDNGDAFSTTLNLDNVFVARDTDGDAVVIAAGVSIDIENDIPVLVTANSQVAVGEDTLPGGNPDAGDTKTLTANGSLSGLVNFGADGPGSFAFDLTGQTLPTLTSGGLTVKYAVSPDGLTLIAYTGANSSLGQVFTVTFTNATTGAYTFTLKDQIDHLPNTPANDDNQNLTIQLSNLVVAKDADGDVVRLTAGFSVLVEDDIPLPYTTAPAGVVATNTGTDYTTGNLALNLPQVGADQPGSVTFTQTSGLVTGFIGTSPTASTLQAGGANLSWSLKPGDDTVLQAKTAGGVVAFEIDLNPANGTYTFSQFEQITATVNVDLVDLSNVGGGNVAAKAINVAGSVFDLAISTEPGETINSSSTTIGVGGGQSMSTDDVVRIDFVTVASVSGSGGSAVPTYGEYYQVNTFKQDVTGLNNTQFADFTVKAITVDQASPPPNGPADGDTVFYGDTNDDFIIDNTTLNIYGDDGVNGTNGTLLASFDVNGNLTYSVLNWQTLASAGNPITVTKLGDGSGWQILNLPQGYDYEIGSTTAFNAVQVQSVVGSNTFKLGFIDINVLQVQGVSLSVPIALTDADGDQVTSSIAINLAAPPLVFDLDGDGAEFLSLAAGVKFAYNGDPIGTAWAAPDDGLLALDRNGNGTVDDASELVFGGPGTTDLQGLAATYDSNQDGKLDAQDSAFSGFGVWQDANSNGVTDAGEFHSLTELDIVSLLLESDGVSYTAADGDVTVHGTTTYTKADGSTGKVADATFATGEAEGGDAAAVQDALGATADVLLVDAVVDHFAANDTAPPPAETEDADLIALLNSSIASSVDQAPPVTMESFDDQAALAAAAA